MYVPASSPSVCTYIYILLCVGASVLSRKSVLGLLQRIDPLGAVVSNARVCDTLRYGPCHLPTDIADVMILRQLFNDLLEHGIVRVAAC